MSGRKMALSLLMAGAVTVLAVGMAFAQDAGGGAAGGGGGGGGGRGGRGGRGGGGGGGGYDAAAIQQRMENQIKETLGATDDEWKALQPRVEKVMTLSMQQMRGNRMGMGGRGGRGNRGGNAAGDTTAQTAAPVDTSNWSDLQLKIQALSVALENKDTKPEEIVAKLQAVRDAREKAKAELAKAQKSLSELLTPKQEAQLVVQGLLE